MPMGNGKRTKYGDDERMLVEGVWMRKLTPKEVQEFLNGTRNHPSRFGEPLPLDEKKPSWA